MICICCPLGCALTAVRDKEGEITVTGNTCPRGEAYAKNECLSPKRTVTTTVRVKGEAQAAMVSVKTAGEIPKDKIMDCIRELAGIEVALPVRIGDVVLKNVAGTGIDVVATKNIEKK